MPERIHDVPLESLVSEKISYGVVQPGTLEVDGVPIVRVKDVRGGKIDTSDPLVVSRDVEEKYARTRLRGGEVLLTLVGSVGEVAVASEEICGWNVARAIAVVRPSSEVTAQWLRLILSSDPAQQYFHDRLNTTVQATLNLKDVRTLPVPMPPRRERDAVCAVVGALDDKIAVNERIAATYEQLLQCRFAELGLGDEPDGESEIPITDLIAFGPKLGKPAAAEPVYVDMAALQTNRAGIPSWTRREPKSGPRFVNGDTLMARITPCLENGKTGYVDFMEDGEIGLGSTEFIVLRSLPGVPSELSYFLARDSRFREHAIRNMVGSSGRQRVSAADASNYSVRSPDAEQLAAFGRESSAAFSHMKSLESESRTLAALRDTLLPQLMSGRLRVKDAEKIVEDHV
ncbi:restriction endonuclease subunit S [Streptomyces genisteinicus]|uniref:Restriction endonuclease subunit S n=1 Tax=Streptomyces genisteinicus TaxID=2768068 RepID=A0A7H0HX30_9ACTN|nr:restriction endonuclease subunit S [Streptomyces genisteinicus]QNP65096.1 restriction endonuclease subunit S [Streptomyces genisteinicus]